MFFSFYLILQGVSYKFVIAVLMEYIRSLNQFQITVQVQYIQYRCANDGFRNTVVILPNLILTITEILFLIELSCLFIYLFIKTMSQLYHNLILQTTALLL